MKLNFMACVEDDTSSKDLQTRKYSQKKPFDRSHFLKLIKVFPQFQLKSC